MLQVYEACNLKKDFPLPSPNWWISETILPYCEMIRRSNVAGKREYNKWFYCRQNGWLTVFGDCQREVPPCYRVPDRVYQKALGWPHASPTTAIT